MKRLRAALHCSAEWLNAARCEKFIHSRRRMLTRDLFAVANRVNLFFARTVAVGHFTGPSV